MKWMIALTLANQITSNNGQLCHSSKKTVTINPDHANDGTLYHETLNKQFGKSNSYIQVNRNFLKFISILFIPGQFTDDSGSTEQAQNHF